VCAGYLSKGLRVIFCVDGRMLECRKAYRKRRANHKCIESRKLLGSRKIAVVGHQFARSQLVRPKVEASSTVIHKREARQKKKVAERDLSKKSFTYSIMGIY